MWNGALLRAAPPHRAKNKGIFTFPETEIDFSHLKRSCTSEVCWERLYIKYTVNTPMHSRNLRGVIWSYHQITNMWQHYQLDFWPPDFPHSSADRAAQWHRSSRTTINAIFNKSIFSTNFPKRQNPTKFPITSPAEQQNITLILNACL